MVLTDYDQLINKADAFVGQGELKQAESLFQDAINLEPRNEKAYLRLAAMYRRSGKIEQWEELMELMNSRCREDKSDKGSKQEDMDQGPGSNVVRNRLMNMARHTHRESADESAEPGNASEKYSTTEMRAVIDKDIQGLARLTLYGITERYRGDKKMYCATDEYAVIERDRLRFRMALRRGPKQLWQRLWDSLLTENGIGIQFNHNPGMPVGYNVPTKDWQPITEYLDSLGLSPVARKYLNLYELSSPARAKAMKEFIKSLGYPSEIEEELFSVYVYSDILTGRRKKGATKLS